MPVPTRQHAGVQPPAGGLPVPNAFYRVLSGAGKDEISGGLGNDRLESGAGDDLVGSYAGDDTVVAGAGNDNVFTDTGDDGVIGDAGTDLLLGVNDHGDIGEQPDERAQIDAVRLRGARHHRHCGDAGLLPRPGQQPERVEVRDRREEAEPRGPDHQHRHDHDQPGEEHRHHPRTLPPRGTEGEHSGQPHRRQHTEDQIGGRGVALRAPDRHGDGGEDRQQGVRCHRDHAPSSTPAARWTGRAGTRRADPSAP